MKLPDINDKAAVAAYLSAALTKHDPDAFLDALSDVVRAAGVTAVAQDAGLSRDALQKLLSGARKPQHETVVKILAALGMRLTAEAITTN